MQAAADVQDGDSESDSQLVDVQPDESNDPRALPPDVLKSHLSNPNLHVISTSSSDETHDLWLTANFKAEIGMEAERLKNDKLKNESD